MGLRSVPAVAGFAAWAVAWRSTLFPFLLGLYVRHHRCNSLRPQIGIGRCRSCADPRDPDFCGCQPVCRLSLPAYCMACCQLTSSIKRPLFMRPTDHNGGTAPTDG